MKEHAQHQNAMPSHYQSLLWMIVLSFVSMYVLMYAMVDRFGNVFNSVNQFYMAGLMTAPMLLLELLLMGSMYKDRKLNRVLMAIGVVAALVFWTLIRQQTGVGDRQFLRSMIPHHAGAILMCNEADVRDPRVLELCEGIVSSQQSEIALMKSLLDGNLEAAAPKASAE